jgi:cell division protein FtsB
MAGKLSRKKTKVKGLVRITAILLAMIVIIIVYFPNRARLKNLRHENEKLIKKTQDLEAEIAELEEHLSRVGADPYILEKIARDELGIAKEGELVIDIER